MSLTRETLAIRHFDGRKFCAVSTPMVTLATAPGLRTMVLPRPAKVSFVAAGPTERKTALSGTPNCVAGVPEIVHQPVEAFVPFTWLVMRSVTYSVPAAPLLRPSEVASAEAPHGGIAEAPDDANPIVAPTGTPSVIAISAPSRVLESRFTSTYCPQSRDLFTQLPVRILSLRAPRTAFSSKSTYGLRTSSWSARRITIHCSMT